MSAGSKLKNFLFNSFSKKINYRFFNITFIKIYFAMQFFHMIIFIHRNTNSNYLRQDPNLIYTIMSFHHS